MECAQIPREEGNEKVMPGIVSVTNPRSLTASLNVLIAEFDRL
jgi:hypothetical protein